MGYPNSHCFRAKKPGSQNVKRNSQIQTYTAGKQRRLSYLYFMARPSLASDNFSEMVPCPLLQGEQHVTCCTAELQHHLNEFHRVRRLGQCFQAPRTDNDVVLLLNRGLHSPFINAASRPALCFFFIFFLCSCWLLVQNIATRSERSASGLEVCNKR